MEGFTCGTLTVPLDHSDTDGRTLDLDVAVADADEEHVLLVLSGGPGQPAVPLVTSVQAALGPALDEYRLVVLDQRGTGEGAIRCRQLQAAVGGSDVLTPPPAAVRACATTIGRDRRFYSTAETVADLELLRRALGVSTWTIDGISYGSYVAAQYALTYPRRVGALVLDSVVPHGGIDPFLRDSLHGVARVLRDVCGDGSCVSDPARDVAWLVRHGADGVGLLNTLTIVSIVDPTFREMVDVPTVLHTARLGDQEALDDFIALGMRLSKFASEELSAGLHAAALCVDQPFPWGDATVPISERERELREATAQLRASALWPFDRRTASTHGLMQTCLRWPPTPVPSPPERTELPNVPTLLLQGERDLSTVLAWARREVASAGNDARLVVVPDAGHSLQSDPGGQGADAVIEFLLRRS